MKKIHHDKILKSCLLATALLGILLIPIKASMAASPTGDIVGKVTVGYQGWFWAPNDGSPWTKATGNFFHFNQKVGSEADTSYHQVEMWPDTREYETLFATKYSDFGKGQPAKMFSSYTDQTVETHFRWMKENGINTAALQRFGGEVTDDAVVKATRDDISVKVMKSSENNGRKFYIMYDCSGWKNYEEKIKKDWTETIVNGLHLTKSTAYAKQNGKPVVCLWGLGYASAPTNGPGNAEISLRVVNWFKEQGYYVIGGFPGQWRSGTGDSRADFKEVYSAVDMIAPWGVGGVPNYDWTQADLVLADSWGKDYQPMAYAGTSFFWGNRSGKNLFPRNHGDFMWGYFKNYRQLGIKTCYIAMFDEIDEATAIFKVAEDASMQPSDQWFLPLDADGVHCSSDFYMRLTNDGGRMIRGELPYMEQHPTLHVAPVSGVVSNGTYELEPLSASGKRLDINSGVDADGVNAQLWVRKSSLAQAMKIVSVGGGLYEIAPFSAPSRRLNVAGQKSADGTGINIWQATKSSAQRWKITDVGGGVYELEPQSAPGKRLEVNEGSNVDGAQIQIWQSNGSSGQRWRIVPVVVADTTYQLEPLSATGKRLDLTGGVTANGTSAIIKQANNSLSQDWKISDGGKNYYELAPASSNQRLDVNGQGSEDGTPVGSWESNGGIAQKWRLLDIGGGIYELEPQCAPAKRLEVADGSAVKISQVVGDSRQRWRLTVR